MNSLPQSGRLGKRRHVTVFRSACSSLAATIMVALAGLAAAGAADAEPLATHEAVTIRLVADPVDVDGNVRGAVVFDLNPGWKTYWIDPGEAGLAPAITISGGRTPAADLRFPAPRRFEEAGILSTGYTEPVGVGFTARDVQGRLEARIAIGVCKTLCIPVVATLDLPIRSEGSTDALVEWTFEALPDTSNALFSARLSRDGTALLVNVAGGALSKGADVFASGPPGWSFGVASRTDPHDFSLPILARREGTAAPRLHIVLADGEKTIEAASVPVDMTTDDGR